MIGSWLQMPVASALPSGECVPEPRRGGSGRDAARAGYALSLRGARSRGSTK